MCIPALLSPLRIIIEWKTLDSLQGHHIWPEYGVSFITSHPDIALPYVIRDKVVGAGDARVGQRRAGLFLFKVMPTRGWMRGMRAKLR